MKTTYLLSVIFALVISGLCFGGSNGNGNGQVADSTSGKSSNIQSGNGKNSKDDSLKEEDRDMVMGRSSKVEAPDIRTKRKNREKAQSDADAQDRKNGDVTMRKLEKKFKERRLNELKSSSIGALPDSVK